MSAEMLITHSSQWHSSQKMRTRLASPSCLNTSAMIRNSSVSLSRL